MAIRKRPGANGLSYQVYWNNPYTSARESRTFHSLAEARKYESLVKHRLKFETESFKPEQLTREGCERTVEDAVFLYLQDRKLPAANTKKFLSSLRLPLEWEGHIPLAEFSTETWEGLLKRLKATPKCRGSGFISAAFVHGILSNLRTVIRWAYDRGMLDMLPKMKVPSPNYEKIMPPTPEEAQRIFAAAPEHLKRVIILGMMLGLRVGASELLSLKWSHVDLAQNIVVISTSRKNPGHPWREVPIPATAQGLFQQWSREDSAAGIDYVVSYKGRKVDSVKRAWAASLRRAGISRRIRPYDLRHAFASQLIANGYDVGTVAMLLGHSSPQMVYQHYQHVSTLQKRAAVDSLAAVIAICPDKFS